MQKEKISQTKTCALIYGETLHYIDHLAPLASYLDIPLIVTEIAYKELIEKQYPDVKPFYIAPSLAPWTIVENFSYLISCLPKAFLKEAFSFAEESLKKKVQTIWCPHGNSDKGWKNPFMKKLKEESLLLIYGEKMAKFLKEMEVNVPYIPIGNYRKWYYEKNVTFYQTLLEKEIFSHLPKKAKATLLFAPTWDDSENSSSFSYLKQFANEIPDDYTLLVKLHPNTMKQKEKELIHLEALFEKNKNLFLIKELQTIYPLLDRVDLYIGDMSSIGYDFLSFQKPMCFFNPQKKSGLTTFLFQCGKELSYKKGQLFSQLAPLLPKKGEDQEKGREGKRKSKKEGKEEMEIFAKRQKAIHEETFSSLTSKSTLLDSIEKLLSSEKKIYASSE